MSFFLDWALIRARTNSFKHIGEVTMRVGRCPSKIAHHLHENIAICVIDRLRLTEGFNNHLEGFVEVVARHFPSLSGRFATVGFAFGLVAASICFM
jgi:hypothetical protein